MAQISITCGPGHWYAEPLSFLHLRRLVLQDYRIEQLTFKHMLYMHTNYDDLFIYLSIHLSFHKQFHIPQFAYVLCVHACVYIEVHLYVYIYDMYVCIYIYIDMCMHISR